MKNTYSVDLKDIRLAWPNNRPYVVGWGSGYSFGATSEAEALALAERALPGQLERHRGGVCIEIARFCETCKVTGIKPGCKRKKCLDCAGRGLVGRYGFPVLKEGVEA